jgi:protein-export membrane protein SecD
MTKNSYILTAIILASVVLFVFVAPQYVNRGIDWTNATTKIGIPHVWNVPFRLGLDLLGGTHLVYQADLSEVGGQSKGDAMQGVRDVIERRVNFFGVSEPVVQVSGDDRLIVELAGISDVNQAIQLIGETPFLEFREASPDAEAIVAAQRQGKRLNEDPFVPTGLNGKHVARAQVVFDQQTYRPQVSLELTSEGGKLFAQITKKNLGKTVAIYLDGAPISAPTVESEITDGKAVITGSFTPQEAKLLATRLNSGALPVPIKLISQQTVGASLGKDSLEASLVAGLWGLVFVAIFMVVLYRIPGAVSIVALGVYTLATLAIYKGLPVTLTLSGIAGFILSLGIGVDANVLIFARMREELTLGKPLSVAMLEGFRRSWPSIRDSHVTTFIGAAVLYLFTTSIVKGFALTLGVGVILSLVTSTVVTRCFLTTILRTRLGKYRRLFS